MDIKSRNHLIKKLLYQSCNRGCKETDLIIGSFAKKYINQMSDEELLIFENILSFSDADIYDWYTHKKPLPDEYFSIIMDKLLKFKPI